MTDKELLELAAKAAGLTQHRWCDAWKGMAAYTLQDGYYGPTWNPLKDDGDALRLAIRLRMEIHLTEDWMSSAWAEGLDQGYGCDHGDDPDAATRRAIVFVAAEIGKAMK